MTAFTFIFEKLQNRTHSFLLSSFQNQSVAAFEILTRPNFVVHLEHEIDNTLTSDSLVEKCTNIFLKSMVTLSPF